MSDSRPTLQLEPTDYALLVNAVVDYAIYMLDLDGYIVSWNAGAERIKGYSRSEIIGQHFSRFFTEPDRQAGKPFHALAMARAEGRFQDEGWRVRKDGSYFWALTVVDAVRDDDGQLIGLAKITRDMTEQHRAQQARLDSERNFRLLVDAVTDYAIYMLDPDGRISSWNSGAERIKGYESREVLGTHFSRFFTEPDLADGLPARALATALREGRFAAEGWRVRKTGEQFRASVLIDPIYNDDGWHIGFAKVTRDISERYEAELKLEQTRQQLLQSQKLEALGQLTGGLAHDFNNLLTIIRGAADLAGRMTADTRLQRQIEIIGEAADRGAGITRQLLTFARRQPLQTQTIQPDRMLRKALPLLEQTLRSDIRLTADIASDLPDIDIDPQQLELALLNLTINARDAIKAAGTLHLRAWCCQLSGEIDELRGTYVAISLRDSGVGMSDEVRSRVFEPFFTTKRFGKGTGLGLSQVHGFAKQSNGTVQVDSTPGHGTTFTLYFPARDTLSASDTPANGNRRILLVEDDTNLSEVTSGMLEMMGYEVIEAHSASEALTQLSRVARIDLLFTDVIMPGGTNGVELANLVRERLPEVPILLTTGFSDTATAHTSYPLLPKPYTYDNLANAVQSLL